MNPATNGASTSSLNPHNDMGTNVVLVSPASSDISAGTIPTVGVSSSVIACQAILSNNVISFELATNTTAAIIWGDSTNRYYLGQLTKSILAMNTVKMMEEPLLV